MDMHEVAALLNIEEKTREHPNLKALHDAVMRQLESHSASYLAQLPEPEEPETFPVTLTATDEPTLDRRV